MRRSPWNLLVLLSVDWLIIGDVDGKVYCGRLGRAAIPRDITFLDVRRATNQSLTVLLMLQATTILLFGVISKTGIWGNSFVGHSRGFVHAGKYN